MAVVLHVSLTRAVLQSNVAPLNSADEKIDPNVDVLKTVILLFSFQCSDNPKPTLVANSVAL